MPSLRARPRDPFLGFAVGERKKRSDPVKTRGTSAVNKMEIKKALFFKPGAIGDTLHTLPALRAFKTSYPTSHITFVVSPGSESLVQGTPLAHRVLVFDKSKFKGRIGDLVRFGLQLRRERYDLFVDLQHSLRSWVLRLLSGARTKLVYRKQKESRRWTERLHAAQNFVETLRPLGITERVTSIELPVKSDALHAVERLLAGRAIDRTRPIVALNCGVSAARPARNWLPERFAELADRLRDELGASVVFIGGNEDRELIGQVLKGMRGQALSLAGELSLDQSAALLSKCVCLVSSDTGPLHLATAVQTPVIGLYGSTDPRRTGPVGEVHRVIVKNLDCVPCEQKDCPLNTRACMAAISVDEVLEAVRSVITGE